MSSSSSSSSSSSRSPPKKKVLRQVEKDDDDVATQVAAETEFYEGDKDGPHNNYGYVDEAVTVLQELDKEIKGGKRARDAEESSSSSSSSSSTDPEPNKRSAVEDSLGKIVARTNEQAVLDRTKPLKRSEAGTILMDQDEWLEWYDKMRRGNCFGANFNPKMQTTVAYNSKYDDFYKGQKSVTQRKIWQLNAPEAEGIITIMPAALFSFPWMGAHGNKDAPVNDKNKGFMPNGVFGGLMGVTALVSTRPISDTEFELTEAGDRVNGKLVRYAKGVYSDITELYCAATYKTNTLPKVEKIKAACGTYETFRTQGFMNKYKEDDKGNGSFGINSKLLRYATLEELRDIMESADGLYKHPDKDYADAFNLPSIDRKWDQKAKNPVTKKYEPASDDPAIQKVLDWANEKISLDLGGKKLVAYKRGLMMENYLPTYICRSFEEAEVLIKKTYAEHPADEAGRKAADTKLRLRSFCYLPTWELKTKPDSFLHCAHSAIKWFASKIEFFFTKPEEPAIRPEPLAQIYVRNNAITRKVTDLPEEGLAYHYPNLWVPCASPSNIAENTHAVNLPDYVAAAEKIKEIMSKKNGKCGMKPKGEAAETESYE